MLANFIFILICLYCFQGKLPLTGIQVVKLDDTDNYKNAFEISGKSILFYLLCIIKNWFLSKAINLLNYILLFIIFLIFTLMVWWLLGPLIETIVAVCQTKEDQTKWVSLIKQQSANFCSRSFRSEQVSIHFFLFKLNDSSWTTRHHYLLFLFLLTHL